MINILVVDDQKHIRDGLQAMLRQFPLQLETIYGAHNGIEALRLLREHPIQLVITDIRMPDMDGLELMDRMKEERLQADCLIISGYSDFAYAQRAIGLGAKGYLLKPVKREDLLSSVEQVMEEVIAQRQLLESREHLTQREREIDRKELRMFMQGASNEDSWIARTESHHSELWSHYRLCLIREELWINRPGAVSVHTLETIAYRVYGRQGYLCLQHRPNLIAAVDADIDPAALTAALQAEQLNAIVVMTDVQHGLRRLPESFVQLQELLKHSYLFPEQRCLLPKHIEGLEQQWQIPYDALLALFQLIGTKNSGRIAEGLSALFHKSVLQRYHIRYTQQLSGAFVQLLEDHERVIRPYMGEERLDLESLRNVFDYPGIREYIQELQRQLLRLNQFYEECNSSIVNTQDLNDAIRYIHDNYHKPLDLAMVSNHMSLNYSYFSNLFKKKIGKSFAEYLRDVRLDKARKLLVSTDLKIAEVAAMVGYESYKSFTRAFRESTGLQPTEYRQLIRLKQESVEQTLEAGKSMRELSL